MNFREMSDLFPDSGRRTGYLSPTMRQDPTDSAGVACAETQLSPSRAFVVQLTDKAGPAMGELEGRVEHLSTGRRIRFASGRDLLDALTRMAAEFEERPRRADAAATHDRIHNRKESKK